MTGDRNLFTTFLDRHLEIRVADRTLPGRGQVGILKSNNLGLKHGLFHASLGSLFLVSVSQIRENGGIVHFERWKDFVKSAEGQFIQLYFLEGLPRVSLTFDTTGVAECHLAYGLALSAQEKLKLHQRHAHCYIEGLNINLCHSCKYGKLTGVGHRSSRPGHLKPAYWLQQVDWDFLGKYPTSLFGNQILLNAIETFHKWPESYPIPSKDKAPDCLQKFCNKHRRPNGACMVSNRTDNEPLFHGENSRWRLKNAELGAQATFSEPFEGPTNGEIERFNRTCGKGIRTNLAPDENNPDGVDKRLWDFCAKYFCHIFQRAQRYRNVQSPYAKLKGYQLDTSYFRRFGCECFPKVFTPKEGVPGPMGKLKHRCEHGVFLGYSENSSSYLCGVWRWDGRVKNYRFTVIENSSVDFNEQKLIANVESLKPKSPPRDAEWLSSMELTPVLIDPVACSSGSEASSPGQLPPVDSPTVEVVQGGETVSSGSVPQSLGSEPKPKDVQGVQTDLKVPVGQSADSVDNSASVDEPMEVDDPPVVSDFGGVDKWDGLVRVHACMQPSRKCLFTPVGVVGAPGITSNIRLTYTYSPESQEFIESIKDRWRSAKGNSPTSHRHIGYDWVGYTVFDGETFVAPKIFGGTTPLDGRVFQRPDGVVVKKRGRKPGTKAKPGWKTPGRKPKSSSTGASANLTQVSQAPTSQHSSAVYALLTRSLESQELSWLADHQVDSGAFVQSSVDDDAWYAYLMLCGAEQDAYKLENETVVCHQVITVSRDQVEGPNAVKSLEGSYLDQLSYVATGMTVSTAPCAQSACGFTVSVSRKEAFSGPDREKWLEADSLERAQLEALGCWRPVTPGECKKTDQIIPAVVLYTRKRCGRYKARMVALGNHQTAVTAEETFSPTVSHAANRFLLVEAAAKGHYINCFDISNAFIRGVLDDDDRVFVRLPPHWRDESNKQGLVRLVKSLYGLRIAPRKWYDTYSKYLLSDGWERCPREPGLFRKGQMILTIYVDDSLIAGPNKQEVEAATRRILDQFAGKIIHPVLEDGGRVQVWDILGASFRYDQQRRWCKFSMEDAVDRLLKKHKLDNVKTYTTPVARSLDLQGGGDDTTYLIRNVIGSLMYIATICRPDILYAVQRLSRYMHKCTKNVVASAKRVAGFLRATRTLGLEYSPEIEKCFYRKYEDIARSSKRQMSNVVAFSDADFAGDTVSLKSTSGSIMYSRGVPICWSSKLQSVKALSTCEAEYMGLFDTIQMTRSQGYLDWFVGEGGYDIPLTFTDNQSALQLAGNSLITKRSKHIALRYHVVRDFVQSLAFVRSKENKADPLTKALNGGDYLLFWGGLPDDFPEESLGDHE